MVFQGGWKRRSFDFAGWEKEVEVSESKLHVKTMLWQCMRDKGKWNFYEDFLLLLSQPRTRIWVHVENISYEKCLHWRLISQQPTINRHEKALCIPKRRRKSRKKLHPEEANQKKKWKFQLWIMRRGKFENSSYPARKRRKNPHHHRVDEFMMNMKIESSGRGIWGERKNEKRKNLFRYFWHWKLLVCPFYFYTLYVDDDNTNVCK